MQTDEVNNNTLPTAPKNPNRPATAQYTYFFHAWQPDIAPDLEYADYTAQYIHLPSWIGMEMSWALQKRKKERRLLPVI